jgi:RNA polymerase sigma-70 factor (ECF subfamily)
MDAVTPDSAETQRLLEEVRNGGPEAFNRLFARHRPGLRELVELRMDPRLRARVDPSDVVQETQLEAFRRLADFLDRRPMPFRLWLRKTAQERLLMLQRRHVHAARRATEREVPLPDRSSHLLAQRLLASGPTPVQQLGREELSRRLQQALARLTEADREILLMRTLEDLSYQEIGYLLEIDAAAARKRHGRALIRLHKILSEDGLTESNL